MIAVFKLVTSETILGEVDYGTLYYVEESINAGKAIEVTNPMYIESDADGMKLRDPLILSSQEQLIFKSNDIITCYMPIETLIEYYHSAIIFSKKIAKIAAHKQIEYAIEDLETYMREEETINNKLINVLMKAAGSSGSVH